MKLKNNMYFKVVYNKNPNITFYNLVEDNQIFEVGVLYNNTYNYINSDTKVIYRTLKDWHEQTDGLIETIQKITKEQLEQDILIFKL